jgi:tetratricopeptide (TPR) repeat protein
MVIQAFQSSSPIEAQAAQRVSDALSTELLRYGNVRIALEHDIALQAESPASTQRFDLRGTIRVDDASLTVSAEVIDRSSGEDLWRDVFRAVRVQSTIECVDDIARLIASCVGSAHGVIVRTLVSEQRKHLFSSDLSYCAILRSYHRSYLYQPGDLVSTLEAVSQLTEREPERALAWSHLALLYLENHSYALSDLRTPIDKSINAGYRALSVDPSFGLARCVVAAALLVKGETQAAAQEVHKLLQILGDSLAFREIAGSLLALCGEWDLGMSLMSDALHRNPYCSPSMNQALWAFHMLHLDFELAHRAALAYQDSSGFWRELMLACSLRQLGRRDEARANVVELLRSRPDFPHRAKELTSYYIKSSSLRDLIEATLGELGVRTTDDKRFTCSTNADRTQQ